MDSRMFYVPQPAVHCPLMSPKTEGFLNFLLGSAESLARPTFRNLAESCDCAVLCATKASDACNTAFRSRPDSMEAEREIPGGGKINVESLILLEARPCAGESEMEIVARAWDFDRLNRRHARHLKVLKERPGGTLRSDAAAKALRRWAATEREAWLDAVGPVRHN
jgi:hypothetical protein